MIRLFDRDETDFNHNETVLNDVISAEPDVLANGMYELVMEYPRNEFAKQLTEGKIIKAPTANGDQLFRIYKPIKNLTTYTIYARHIFYDLLTNFLEDVRPTKTNGQGALNAILNQAEIDQGFTGISDISNIGTAYYIRKSPVEALLGADNSFTKVWGGELVRDNHTIKVLANAGQDRGYEVTIGKNLQGIEVTTDESNVFTRVYPTVVIDDQVVTTLPEKYVDSPIIDRYEYPRIIEERIDLTDEQKELPLSEIYKLMRIHVDNLFEQGIDKPEVNFKIDFVELSRTEQYKHLKILEQLELYDMVMVYVPELDVDVIAKVIRTKYDSLRKKYLNMELGSFKADGGTQAKNTINRIDKKVTEASSYLQQAFEEAQNMITGNLGGHVIMRLNAEGKPYELLVMDTEDIQTASNVIRLNQQGIGFSKNGYNGPFGVAITIDGKLNAEIINVFNLSASVIRTGILESYNNLFSLNMDSGKAILKDGEFSGLIEAEEGHIAGWELNEYALTSPTGDVEFRSEGGNALVAGFEEGMRNFVVRRDGELYAQRAFIDNVRPDQRTTHPSYIGNTDYPFTSIHLEKQPVILSDLRKKKNVQPIPVSILDKMTDIQPKMYKKDGQWHFGYIAQDVERVFYKEIIEQHGHEKAENIKNYFGIVDKDTSYMALLYGEIHTLKDAKREQEVNKLKDTVEKLEERLAKLEQRSE